MGVPPIRVLGSYLWGVLDPPMDNLIALWELLDLPKGYFDPFMRGT